MKSRLVIRGPFAVALALLLGACVSTTTGDLKSEPNNVDAAELNYTLGVRYFENGSYELARDRLLLAIELNPRLALAHTSLGQTYEALENPRLANEHYDKSVRVAPRNYDVQNAYAVFQCRNKKYDKAIVHFDKAIEHPENDNAHVTMTNAGMCMVRKPDYDKAEQYYRAALERRSNYGDALLQLCLMKFGLKDYLAARAFLQRYMSANVTTPSVLLLASRIEEKLGNDRGKTEYENRLIREFPKSSEARKVLGAG